MLLTLGYSYKDDEYEYRHVQLPKAMLKVIPKEYHDTSKGTLKLLWEDEWRAMGITQVCSITLYARYKRWNSESALLTGLII